MKNKAAKRLLAAALALAMAVSMLPLTALAEGLDELLPEEEPAASAGQTGDDAEADPAEPSAEPEQPAETPDGTAVPETESTVAPEEQPAEPSEAPAGDDAEASPEPSATPEASPAAEPEETLPDEELTEEEEVSEADASWLGNPVIAKDKSLNAGQKVTYQCVWFGSYPQAELVADSADIEKHVYETGVRDGDFIVDADIYDYLSASSEWDSNNDLVCYGKKYHRVKCTDATVTAETYPTNTVINYDLSSDMNFYNWNGTTNEYRYFRYQPVKWRVLNVDKTSGKALLLADMVLDMQYFDNSGDSAEWENSSVRSWLNDTFCNMAFSAAEKAALCTTSDMPETVSLLSSSQIATSAYGFVSAYSDEAKVAYSSTYAKAMGCWWTQRNAWLENISSSYAANDVSAFGGSGKEYIYYDGTANWMLRDRSDSGCVRTVVSGYGFDTQWASDTGFGVRPAVTIDINTSAYSYAGTVCTNGTKEEEAPEEPWTEGIVTLKYNSGSGEHDFYYSDSFFYGDNETYNNQLAVMSLGLELTSWTATMDNYTVQGSSADSAVAKARRANIRDAYAKLGFTNAEYHNYEKKLSDDDDKVAYSFATRYVSNDGYATTDTLIAVVVRGGGYGAEWASNFNVDDSDDHEGFESAAEGVFNKLNQYCEKLQEENLIQGNVKFWVVGYSRGAAVANLTAAKIYKNSGESRSLTGFPQYIPENELFAYTFATPNNTDTPSTIPGLFNVVSANDLVPMMPLARWGFGKYGTTYMLPESTLNKVKQTYKSIRGKELELNDCKPVADLIMDALYELTEAAVWTGSARKGYYEDYQKYFMDVFRQNNAKAQNDSLLGSFVTAILLGTQYGSGWDVFLGTMTGKRFLENFFEVSVAGGTALTDCLTAIAAGELDETNFSINQAHDPEHYLSWLESAGVAVFDGKGYAKASAQKKAEIESAIRKLFQQSYKKYQINCPVDVRVYDADGNLVAEIVDNEVNEEVARRDGALSVYVDGDRKVVYIPADAGYRIECTGNDTGSMDYSVDEIDSDGEVVRSVFFYDVALTEGQTYEGTAEGGINEADADYSLTDGSTTTEAALDTYGMDLENAEQYEVTTVTASENAETPYEGGNLVHSDTYGGMAGERVAIYTSIDGGYYVTGWHITNTATGEDVTAELLSTDEMTIGDRSTNMEAAFCMPAYDVTVTAFVEKIDGLSIRTIPDQTYTGKAVTPEIAVYDGSTLLTLNKDYTLKFSNNTAVASSNAAKAPTVTVTGKGNYSGKDTATFSIVPANIGSADIAEINLTDTGKAQTLKPVIKYGGKTLKAGTDYTLSAASVDPLADSTQARTDEITVTGKGSFTGTAVLKVTVSPKNSTVNVSKLSVKLEYTKTAYKGDVLTPSVTVMNGKTQLKENKHYTLSYSNNCSAGTATVTVTGIESAGYTGSKTLKFTITGTALSKAVIDGLNAKGYTYTGEAIKPAITLYTDKAAMAAKDASKCLVEGDDYTVSSITNNVKAGTATLLLTGLGEYTGTVKKTFKITAYNAQTDLDGKISIEVENADSVPYAKGGAMPEVTVTFGETVLTEGTDYTVSYANNKAVADKTAAKAPAVNIAFKGNFSGKVSAKFTITEQDINALRENIAAADVTYSPKAGAWKQKTVTVTDLDGKKLAAKTDYNITGYVFAAETTIGGVTYAAGEPIPDTAVLDADTTVKVLIQGVKAYADSTACCTYRVTAMPVSKAIAAKAAVQTYTGSGIEYIPVLYADKNAQKAGTPLEGADINGNSTLTGEPVEEGDEIAFKIIGYKNNVNKGTATVIVQGVGNYGGTREIKYTIGTKSIIWWFRSLLN